MTKHARKKAPNGEPLNFLRSLIGTTSRDCILWPFASGGRGAGWILFQGVGTSPSRAMCILAHGEPPSPTHHAAHDCGKGNDGCVNPNHVYWATPVENNADKVKHGTQYRGSMHPASKLDEEKVIAIRALSGKKTQEEIAAIFGVNDRTIGTILRRETWRHI